MKTKTLISILLLCAASLGGLAQKVALKTNLLYDATATINLGAELSLAPQWTLDVSGDFNAWSKTDRKVWKHWFIQPEARYWLCDKFQGSFFAAHAITGQFNMGRINNSVKILGADFGRLSDFRYQGWMMGAGIAYGYALPIGRHFNIEGEIGIGVIHTKYDKFKCAGCGKKLESGKSETFLSPTKAAINIVYLF